MGRVREPGSGAGREEIVPVYANVIAKVAVEEKQLRHVKFLTPVCIANDKGIGGAHPGGAGDGAPPGEMTARRKRGTRSDIRVHVCAGRDFADRALLFDTLALLHTATPVTVLIQGAAVVAIPGGSGTVNMLAQATAAGVPVRRVTGGDAGE